MNVTVRSLEPADRAEWLRLRAALWPAVSVSEHAIEIEQFFRGEALLAAVFVWPRARTLGGFLELSVRSHAEGCHGPVPYIEGWYIDTDARGHGGGRALLAAAETWARDRGYREMASDTQLENLASCRVHLALGFQEVERAIHFRKRL